VDLGEVELAASFFRPDVCERDTAAPDAGPRADRATADAGSRSSGLRLAPDERHSLIAKDVGGLRWTMSYDHDGGRNGTMTGNVFDPSGGPARFVSCSYEGGAPEAHFSCVGASGCGCGACRKTDWQPLPDVTVPSSFFHARRCPGTPAPRGLVATLEPSRSEDAIDEQGPNRAFAANVAISGDVVVAGSGEKAVYIFENGPDGWSEAARIEPFEPSDIPGRGRFGTQVDVSGARAVILDDHTVRIVERGDGTWTRVSTIVPPEPDAQVGRVAVAGSTVALTVDFRRFAQPERVHVYEETGGAWRRAATISLPGRDPFERVLDMHLSEERLAVLVLGAASSGDTPNRASIEVLEQRSGEWLPTSSVAIPYSPIDSARLAFALAGDDLVVGSAPIGLHGSLFPARGTVRGLTREGGGWTVTEELTACSPDVGRFGQVLAVSGDTLVVGAPDGTEGGSAGEVHVFTRGAVGWTARGRLRVGDTAIDSVALDSRTLVVGSTLLHSPTGGTIQVFDLDEIELLPPVPCPDDPPAV
jgi:hypothetical protein